MCKSTTSTHRERVSDGLIKLRSKLGLSQLEVAELIGASRRQYQRYENQEADIPFESVITIKEKYGVDLNIFDSSTIIPKNDKDIALEYLKQAKNLLCILEEKIQRI